MTSNASPSPPPPTIPSGTPLSTASARAPWRRWLRAAPALVVLLTLGYSLLRIAYPPPPKRTLPSLGELPTFAFRDQRERPVSDASLRGSVNIVDFFFTSCPIACPKLTKRLAEVEQLLSERNRDRASLPVRLVSISVDPENDTPAKLADYAKRYGANDDRWWFLTGEGARLSEIVVKGFKVNYQDANPELGIFEILHGNWFVLVDRRGAIRGYYLSDDPGRVKELVEDAEALAREPS